MSIFKGKQKAWVAFVVPWAIALVIEGLRAAGVDVPDPSLIETGIMSVLSGLGVYQVANAK